jgi:DNA repair exonuclease SbcCD ATPase subunit
MDPAEKLYNDDHPVNTAIMLGQIATQLKTVCSQLDQTVSSVNKQTEVIHETQLEMGRYWAGLENANKDIQSVRDTQTAILSRLENAVSKEQFQELEAHVKTLNGTDSKFRMLGIDINDPKSVEEWREVFHDSRSRSRMVSSVRTRVLQGLALAVAMALCIAAWNGIKDDLIVGRAEQEQTK